MPLPPTTPLTATHQTDVQADDKGGVKPSSANVENLCPKKFYHGRRTTARNFLTEGENTGYVYLAIAIVLELCGTTCMKLSDGFGNKIFTAGTLTFYGACFYFFAMSLKTVPLNIAYATWGGLGVVLAAAVAKIFFHESISTAGTVGIIFVVVGVVLCNFFNASH